MAMFANGIDSENTGIGTWGWDLKNAMTPSTSPVHELPINYWTNGPGGTPDYLGYFTYMKSNEHINYFITKAGSGNNAFVNAGGVTNYTSAVFTAAHSAGIKILPYFYIYGGSTTHGAGITTSVSGEISIFNNIMSTIGGDGAVLDIENEYLNAVPLDGSGNQHEAIVDYMTGIGKSQLGNGTGSRDGFFISYSSFPYANSHSQVPFVELGDYCDATMPQAYWSSWVTVPSGTRSRHDGETMTPTIMVDDVNSEYAPLSFEAVPRQNIFYNKPNSIKPIILTGMTYNSAVTTTPAQITEFITAAKNSTNIPIVSGSATSNVFQAYGYRGINWFDENNTSTAERAAIAGQTVGVLPGMPANATPSGSTAGPVTTLNWDDVVTTNTTGAATSYDVYLDSVFKGNTTSSQWPLSPSITTGSHTWYVIAKNLIGNTTLSPTVSFTIPTPPPSTPSNPTPANNEVRNTTFSKLDWDDTPGATSYVVYIGTSGTSFTSSISEFAVSPSDGVKFWQVKAVNSGGETLGPQWQYTLDRVVPTATYGGETPTGGANYLDFTVTYSDTVSGLAVSTLDSSDITVTGPGGYSQGATLVSVDTLTNGSPRIATYRIPAPGGTWNLADSGTYTVTQNLSQVSDVAGNFRGSGTISTFNAAVPFAYKTGNDVSADYDGSGQPIVLTQSGTDLQAVQNGVTLNFTGVTSTSVNTTSGNNIVNVSGVTMPLFFGGGNGLEALNVVAGTYAINGDIGVANPAIVVSASGTGAVTFTGNQHLAGLNLTGSSVALQTSGNGYFQVDSMTIGASAALDLNDNDLVVNNATFTDLQGRVLEGYSGGPDTTKTGIVSTAGQNEGGVTILALFDNALAGMSEWPPGSGNSIATGAILGKYTYIGDTNMDGQVTPQDYTATDSNLGTSADPSISWFYGDTNFDGNIDATDYAGIDSALGLGASNPLAVATFSQTRIKNAAADDTAQREDLLSVLS
jgi:hypothetical protein